jgi:hypothetical protein
VYNTVGAKGGVVAREGGGVLAGGRVHVGEGARWRRCTRGVVMQESGVDLGRGPGSCKRRIARKRGCEKGACKREGVATCTGVFQKGVFQEGGVSRRGCFKKGVFQEKVSRGRGQNSIVETTVYR